VFAHKPSQQQFLPCWYSASRKKYLIKKVNHLIVVAVEKGYAFHAINELLRMNDFSCDAQTQAADCGEFKNLILFKLKTIVMETINPHKSFARPPSCSRWYKKTKSCRRNEIVREGIYYENARSHYARRQQATCNRASELCHIISSHTLSIMCLMLD
jgi:hypothetical protein